jgi:hypothetical protein
LDKDEITPLFFRLLIRLNKSKALHGKNQLRGLKHPWLMDPNSLISDALVQRNLWRDIFIF